MGVVAQWIHVLSAALAVGGVVFVRLALLPAAREADSDEGQTLAMRSLARFRPILWSCIGLLLVTGLYNSFQVAVRGGLTVPAYTHVLMTKIVLALGMFAFALTAPGELFAGIKIRRNLWLTVNIILASVVLFLSAFLGRL